MYKIFPRIMIVLIGFFLSAQILAQTAFEGKVKFKITYDDEISYLDYFIKGDNLRIEVGDNNEGVFMNDEEEHEGEPVDFEKFKTGKVKDINGYECHQWVFTDEDEDDEVEAWVTDELGNLGLTEKDEDALVKFMKTLTDGWMP